LLYSFESFTLDTERRELRRGDTALHIEPQIFDLLVYLISNRERVVGRDDLRKAIWNGRIVSEATLGSRINAARGVLGDDGEEQRLIKTLPRKGFRFVGEVREVAAIANQTTPTVAEPPAPVARRPARILVAGGALAAIAVASVVWFTWRSSLQSTPVRKFDAAAIPLLSDAGRRTVADYATWPDSKALAISAYSFGTASGAPNADVAKAAALEQCRATKLASVCRLYAVGMTVEWSGSVLPLPHPADMRIEPLNAPVSVTWLGHPRPDDFLDKVEARKPNHKALAIAGYFEPAIYAINSKDTPAEAARLAVETCSYQHQRPCFVFAVDGFMTVEVPKSRRIVEFFLIDSDIAVSPEARAGIARVYQGRDWRALARGRSGGWYPVSAAASESVAVETALELCNATDTECRIHAIGNFRVADDR
jgi:DNA-binding winged helix-turn-helix (wHTH) protein